MHAGKPLDDILQLLASSQGCRRDVALHTVSSYGGGGYRQ